MLFNAVNYLRSKKEEERQLETLSKEEFQVTQLRWEKSGFSLKEKKKGEDGERGWWLMRPSHELASANVISRSVSLSFARSLCNPVVPTSLRDHARFYLRFHPSCPLYFRLVPLDCCLPIENAKFIHLTATSDTRSPAITCLIWYTQG